MSSILEEFIKAYSEDNKLKNLSIFLMLNLSFMFVEIIYGLISNSLGLLTDGAHMLLDCSAILIGLFSLLLSKKNKNDNYNYGYARSEVLGTFINSVFLIFISIYIVFESIERSIEPKDIHGNHLILVSFLGLLVNFIGIYFFHGEKGIYNTHQSPSCSHYQSQSHEQIDKSKNLNPACENLDNNAALKILDAELNPSEQNSVRCENLYKKSQHIHHHEDGVINENLYAIYIHILADALGSISVLISSFLIRYYDWYFTDPLCSFLLSILILYSTWPVLKSSLKTLLHYLPENIENIKLKIENEILRIDENLSITNYEIWILNGKDIVCELKIFVDNLKLFQKNEEKNNFIKNTKDRIITLFKEKNIKEYCIDIC